MITIKDSRFDIILLDQTLDLSFITDAAKEAIELGGKYTVIPFKDDVSLDYYLKAGLKEIKIDKISRKLFIQ